MGQARGGESKDEPDRARASMEGGLVDRAMSQSEAGAFLRRWVLVRERQREELRAMSPGEKLQRLGMLVELARALAGSEPPPAGEGIARERWRILREAALG